MMRWFAAILIVVLPLIDLAWNLTHLNVGLVDFYGVTLPALGLVQNGAWPATPYFPAGYPLLLIPFGYIGSTLIGGYIYTALGAVLALAGVRRLALELGAPAEWTLAAVALAWAEPTFRITAGSPTPDMLMTGIGVWFLWCAVALWRKHEQSNVNPAVTEGVSDQSAENRESRLFMLMVLCIAGLLLLRYHAFVLVLPILAVLIGKGLAGNPLSIKRRPFDKSPPRAAQLVVLAVAAALVVNFVPYYAQHGHLMSSAAPLQVRVGLEADKPTFFKSTADLFARYSAFSDFARKRSVIKDYGLTAIAKHTLLQLTRFMRRPPVVLALVLYLALLALKRSAPSVMPLTLWMLFYSLALSVAYYTPRVALLVVLAGVAVVFALIPRLVQKRTDLALGVACLLLLVAYWPAGKFARADFAERWRFAEASTRAAQMIHELNLDSANYISNDMRVIRLPSLDNPWQKPFASLQESWLDDPAIYNSQLPGYRDSLGEPSPAP